MEYTAAQIQKTTDLMTSYAEGLPVTVEQITFCLYVFGSELAVLRIFARYNANGAVHNPKARVGYSTNRKTFYLSLEV